MTLTARQIKKITRKRGFRIKSRFDGKHMGAQDAKISKDIAWSQSYNSSGVQTSKLTISGTKCPSSVNKRGHMVIPTDPLIRVMVERSKQRVYFSVYYEGITIW